MEAIVSIGSVSFNYFYLLPKISGFWFYSILKPYFDTVPSQTGYSIRLNNTLPEDVMIALYLPIFLGIVTSDF
jgi:hypothetical protein